MKSKKIFLSTALASAFIAATCVTIYSCKDPLTDVELITNLNFTEATIGVKIEDAQTGTNIGFGTSDVVTLAIGGVDAAQIVDISAGTNFKAVQGFAAMATKEGVIPTDVNPVDFTITASCPGYLTTTEVVSIKASGSVGAIIRMIKITEANTTAGVSVVVAPTIGNNANGTTALATVAAPAPASGDQSTAKMDIPIGTDFYSDAAHTQRISDPVGTTFGHFSGTEDASLAMVAASLTNSNGSLKLSSLVSVEMKGITSGKTVKTLAPGQQIMVTQGLAATSLNALGNPIAVGDSIERWSQDETTKIWTLEGKAVVTLGTGTNAFEVTYPVTHFSLHAVGYMATVCKGSVNIDISFANFTYKVQYLQGSTWFTALTGVVPYNATGNQFLLDAYAQSGKTYRIIIEGPDGMTVSTTNLTNCGITQVQGIPGNSKVSVQVTARCASLGGLAFRPTTPVYGHDNASANASDWFYIGGMVDGKLSTTLLVQGHSYRFGTYFDAKWYTSADYTVNQTEYAYDQDLDAASCNKIKR